jgi:valyl-tRNA synthetase
MGLLEQYGSDGVRYWAASARPGTDTAFEESQMRIGRKLATKVLNVSRFVLGTGEVDGAPLGWLEPLDASFLAALAPLVEEATRAFDDYDYARALERTEAFFWSFCDDYVELVKSRAYGTLGEERAQGARRALRTVLSVLLRLFAPVLPFVTEEVWSWWHDAGSIHRASWPSAAELGELGGDPAVWMAAAELLGTVRKAKTAAGLSLAAPAASIHVTASEERLGRWKAAADDVREAGNIAAIDWAVAEPSVEETVTVELA